MGRVGREKKFGYMCGGEDGVFVFCRSSLIMWKMSFV